MPAGGATTTCVLDDPTGTTVNVTVTVDPLIHASRAKERRKRSV